MFTTRSEKKGGGYCDAEAEEVGEAEAEEAEAAGMCAVRGLPRPVPRCVYVRRGRSGKAEAIDQPINR